MTKREQTLAGRVALVTGAAHPQGIGRAIVDAMRAAGASVVPLDLAAAEGLSEIDGRSCDVTDAACVRATVADIVAEHGRLDIVVNNAGVGNGSPDFLALTEDDWALALNVNLLGAVNLCQAALPHLRAGASIINNASLAGLGAVPSMPACYTASKFALVGLTKQLALQYGEAGIRCNALCPGSVSTQMQSQAMQLLAETLDVSLEEAQVAEVQGIALGRTARPQEVAAAAVFLASDASSYLTGVALPVAGGMSPGL